MSRGITIEIAESRADDFPLCDFLRYVDRMKTPAQRGVVGNWLRQQRMERGWETARKALHNLKLAGIDIHESVYREWESGARLPADERLAELVAFYGSSPYAPPADSAHTDAGGALVEAINRQTAAIEAQTQMLALVLSRLVPGAGEPELDELAAQRMYDELRRPRSVPAPAKP